METADVCACRDDGAGKGGSSRCQYCRCCIFRQEPSCLAFLSSFHQWPPCLAIHVRIKEVLVVLVILLQRFCFIVLTEAAAPAERAVLSSQEAGLPFVVFEVSVIIVFVRIILCIADVIVVVFVFILVCACLRTEFFFLLFKKFLTHLPGNFFLRGWFCKVLVIVRVPCALPDPTVTFSFIVPVSILFFEWLEPDHEEHKRKYAG